MINKIDFTDRNLTSNAGLFLLFENAKANGIFELIDTKLIFDNESTPKKWTIQKQCYTLESSIKILTQFGRK